MRTDTMLQDRQVGMVDARGNAASFTGTRTFDWAGRSRGRRTAAAAPGGKGEVIVGRDYAAQAQHHGVRPDGEEPWPTPSSARRATSSTG